MRKLIAFILCIVLCFSNTSIFAKDSDKKEITRKEASECLKKFSNNEISVILPEEKNNEIIVNFMDTSIGERMAEKLLKKMLPDFNFKIEHKMKSTDAFLLSFDTIEAACDAIMILNEFDSIYYACMNIINIYTPDKRGTGTPVLKNEYNCIRLQIGSNVMTAYGKDIMLDSEAPEVVPFIDAESGRTMVPLRSICEIDDVDVVWNKDSREVMLEGLSKNIKLQIGLDSIQIFSKNGQESNLEQIIVSDTVPVIFQDRTFVPLRTLSEILNFNVEWVEEQQEIILRKK